MFIEIRIKNYKVFKTIININFKIFIIFIDYFFSQNHIYPSIGDNQARVGYDHLRSNNNIIGVNDNIITLRNRVIYNSNLATHKT